MRLLSRFFKPYLPAMVLVVSHFSFCFGYTALTDAQCKCVEGRVQTDLKLNPAYLWGGDKLEHGAEKDCSGSLFSYLRACDVRDEKGRPIQRTTAARMGDGRDGWNFPLVKWGESRKLALVNMTMQERRKDGSSGVNGHIGILITDVTLGIGRMAHASSKWGFIASLVEDCNTNYYFPRITRIRQVNW